MNQQRWIFVNIAYSIYVAQKISFWPKITSPSSVQRLGRKDPNFASMNRSDLQNGLICNDKFPKFRLKYQKDIYIYI